MKQSTHNRANSWMAAALFLALWNVVLALVILPATGVSSDTVHFSPRVAGLLTLLMMGSPIALMVATTRYLCLETVRDWSTVLTRGICMVCSPLAFVWFMMLTLVMWYWNVRFYQ